MWHLSFKLAQVPNGVLKISNQYSTDHPLLVIRQYRRTDSVPSRPIVNVLAQPIFHSIGSVHDQDTCMLCS